MINVFKVWEEGQQHHFLVSSPEVPPFLRVMPSDDGYRILLESVDSVPPLSTEQAMIFVLMLERALAIARTSGETGENQTVATRITRLENEIDELQRIMRVLIKVSSGEAMLPHASLAIPENYDRKKM